MLYILIYTFVMYYLASFCFFFFFNSVCCEVFRSNKICLTIDTVQGDEKYHQEFKPPPEGSATGVGKQEQVVSVEDQAHDQDQIQHR